MVPTAGDVPDGKVLPQLVEKDLEQGLPARAMSGDRGYEGGGSHARVWKNWG